MPSCPGAHILHMLDAPLDADIGRHGVNPRQSKVAASPIGSGNSVTPVIDHPVQRLAPPVVGRHAKPRNGAGAIHQLRGLLLERHAVHQIGRALFGRQARILIRQIRRLLSDSKGRSK